MKRKKRPIIYKKSSYPKLPIFILFLVISTAFSAAPATSAIDRSEILGRWDITVTAHGKSQPSWLEINLSGVNTLVGRFVGIVGSARPVAEIKFKDGEIDFTIPPQWDTEKGNLQVKGVYKNNHFEGSMTFDDGTKYKWVGTRAPKLIRDKRPKWGKSIVLFDGKNMKEWQATGENQWQVEDGILRSPHSGSNLVSNKKFQDFKLHIEVRYPSHSNSGIYLRGRYEVQVVDANDKDALDLLFGAIYGFLPPSKLISKANEWQTFDITLVGRMVTVVADGDILICNREIPGITGGAIDSKEGEPGPILLQGDHGPVDYRNIIITPGK